MAFERTKEDMYELVSRNIKLFRKEKGLTQAQLACKTKYTHEYIRRIESTKSKKYFSIDTICNIAEALEIPVSKFFEKHD